MNEENKLQNFQTDILINCLDSIINNIVNNYPLNNKISNDKIINFVCDKIKELNFECSFEDIGSLCNYFNISLRNKKDEIVSGISFGQNPETLDEWGEFC